MEAAHAGLGGLNGQAANPVRGHFFDTRDIQMLTEKMLEEKTAVFGEKYF